MHNIGLALTQYAAYNHGYLPAHAGNNGTTGYWLWDVPIATRDQLVRYGATRQTLYCPFQSDVQNVDYLWTFVPPIDAINRPQDGWSVLGYFFLINRLPDNPPNAGWFPNITAGDPYHGNITLDPNFSVKTWRYQAKITPTNNGCSPTRANLSSETEVVTDATADSGSKNFGYVTGRYPGHTSHWVGGSPFGANILFLDGHAAPRSYSNPAIAGGGVSAITALQFQQLHADVMKVRATIGSIRFMF